MMRAPETKYGHYHVSPRKAPILLMSLILLVSVVAYVNLRVNPPSLATTERRETSIPVTALPMPSTIAEDGVCKSRFYTCGLEDAMLWPHEQRMDRTNIEAEPRLRDYSSPVTFLELLKTHMQEYLSVRFSAETQWGQGLEAVRKEQLGTLKNSSKEGLVCEVNVREIRYRPGNRDEQPMYAQLFLNETCLWNAHDWIMVHLEPQPDSHGTLAPTMNQQPFVTFPERGQASVELPCLGTGGTYVLALYYMMPKCLGSTRCADKYVPGGALRIPLAQEMIDLNCPAAAKPSTSHELAETSTHVPCPQFPSHLPSGLGYYRGEAWHSHCGEEIKLPIDESENIVMHLVGDSTMEEVYSTLKEGGASAMGNSGCGGGVNPEVSARPCHSWYRQSSRGVAFTFTLFTQSMGWKTREHQPAFYNSPNWVGASLSETIVFLQELKHQYPPDAKHVVLFNYGMHGASLHGSFASIFEHSLLQLQQGIQDFASLVAVGVVPTNPFRGSYNNMHCGTEPITAMMQETIACVAKKHGIPFLDRTMLQFGRWEHYNGYVHLKRKGDAVLALRNHIADEFVRAVYRTAKQYGD